MRKVALGIKYRAFEPQCARELGPVCGAAGGMSSEPVELKRCRARFTLPFDAHHAVLSHCRADPRLLGHVGNVEESLAAMRIAVLGQIVTQPEARPHPAPPPPPPPGARLRRGSNDR